MADENTDTDSILSLDTIFVRPIISIDGADHEITAPGELSIEQSYRLADLGRKLSNLRGTVGLAHAQQRQLTETLTAICDIILAPVPADIRAKLNDSQRVAITEVFTMLLSEDRLKLAGATVLKMMNKYLGEKPFPGSSGSTAEVPKAG